MFLKNKSWALWKLLLLVVCILPFAASHAGSRGIITGQVLDSEGAPLEGVSVSVKGSATVPTNAGGMFTLNNVKQKKRIVVTFRKDGYLTTQGTVSLKVKTGNQGRDNDDDDDDDDHDSGKSNKLSQVSLVRSMLKLGAEQTVNNAAGGVIKQDGSKVTLGANSLTVDGDVQITITPIDVSTNAIFAAPGDFIGRTRSGQTVLLETFTMADVSLTQNGQPVNLAPGAQAQLELLLPEATRLQAGDVQPMWYFSEQNGLWIEEGSGTVGASTEIPGRLAVFATVTHFTPWNCDAPIFLTSVVRGRVLDTTGRPLAGAAVQSAGAGFFGTTRATTDSNGYYCLAAPLGVTINIYATYNLSGLTIGAVSSVQVQTASAPNGCNDVGAPVAPTIRIDTTTSCVSGDVLDANGKPVSGATVYSSTGGFSKTDINGVYQLPAPANAQVVVYSVGYPSVAVTTGAASAPCASAPLRISTGGGIACVSGFLYQCTPTNRYPNIQVTVYDAFGNPLGISPPSNANGEYCVDGLPANIDLRVISPGLGRLDTNSGNGGGTCATNSCKALPGIDIFCY